MAKQPLTAAELEEHKLFKISAEIKLSLYREFKAECGMQGLRMKHEIEKAIENHLRLLKHNEK